jgi:hypothetical protein
MVVVMTAHPLRDVVVIVVEGAVVDVDVLGGALVLELVDGIELVVEVVGVTVGVGVVVEVELAPFRAR